MEIDSENNSNQPNNNYSNNNNNNTSNNYDTTDSTSLNMRTIQEDLERVEQQLHNTNNTNTMNNDNASQTIFNSILSALGSIRSRLEQETNDLFGTNDSNNNNNNGNESNDNNNTAATTALTTASAQQHLSSLGTRLMERLQNAELAHSARIPLNMLQAEISRRREQIQQEQRDYASKEENNEEQQPQTPNRNNDSNSNRRVSSLFASRRRVEEAEGPKVDMDLHGTMQSSTKLAREKVVCEEDDVAGENDSIEIVLNDTRMKDIEEDDDNSYGEQPSLLLTKRSRSNLDEARESVLFPRQPKIDYMEIINNSPAEKKNIASTVVYSWGSGIGSLHEHDRDLTIKDIDKARVDPSTRVGRTDIVSCSVGTHHSACTTSTGKVLIAGQNIFGEVNPEEKEKELIVKPIVMESLATNIVSVSCGLNHTAALRANGAVLTWGNNEYGQLGHGQYGTSQTKSFCRPAIMALGPGRRATAVACGDGFTLCLTSRMDLLVCGVQEISGYANNSDQNNNNNNNSVPRLIPALENLPLVSIAAGRRHAVVVTAHGSAFAWGDNSKGCCGREYPKQLIVPVPMHTPTSNMKRDKSLPASTLSHWVYQQHNNNNNQKVALADDVAVIHAACGDGHTVLVTRAGSLLVCGSNRHGQLGMDPTQRPSVLSLETVQHPEAGRRSFQKAEAGKSHTIVLDDVGDVWQLGGCEEWHGISYHQPTKVIQGQCVQAIGAGGNHCVAIAVAPSKTPPRREFSEANTDPSEHGLQIAESVEELIVKISEEQTTNGDGSSSSNGDLAAIKITARAEELFRTPAILNGLFIDPADLEDLFSKLLSVSTPGFRKAISKAIEQGMRKGLESIQSDDSRLMWSEQVRFLLLYVQCPLFVEWKSEESVFDRRGDLILLLCDCILGMPYEGYTALMGWATSVYPRELFVRFLIRPLLAQLEKSLSVEAGAERRPVPHIVSVLRWLYNASERAGNVAKPEDFHSDAISRMSAEALYDDLRRYKNASKQRRAADFFFCDNPFLFSPSTKRTLLQIENEVNMLKTATSNVTYNFEQRAFEFNPYFVMAVDRQFLLQQTLQHISRADSTSLRKKLRVVFKGEDGVDAGGVTREFFLLLSSQLFDLNTGMWSTRFQDGDITWFNSDCSWNDEGFYLTGVLVGLAVYNSVLVDVSFPQAVYRKLLGLPLGLEDMVDEEIKTGLQQLLDYDGDDVEDVFCLNFTVTWMDLGQEKRKELKPNGSNINVTSDNKEEYVMLYVRWLLVESVYPQYESFASGFMKVMEDSTLDLLQPEELELLVTGTKELDFDALEKATTYEGYTADSQVIVNFWRFIKSASKESQLKFLKFTTGATRAPIGGLGQMNFKIQRAGPDSQNLPTSHTCFNTLLLPDYGENYDKLADRLGRAILECEGFGLQ